MRRLSSGQTAEARHRGPEADQLRPLLLGGRLRFKGAYIVVTAVEELLQFLRRGEQRVGNLDVFGLNRSICLAQLGLVLLKKRLPLSSRQPERQLALFAQGAEHIDRKSGGS